ncbi:universal stress protein [Chloroflexota bacterium]
MMEGKMYQKILVPLDGSELAECVLPHVEAIATGCGVRDITFLRVVKPFLIPSGSAEDAIGFSKEDVDRIDFENRRAAEDYLNNIVSRARYDPANVHTEVLLGKVADSIIDYAGKYEADLIAIATHGRSGISRWAHGSVADRVFRSVNAPVLLVRAPGFKPWASTLR